MKELGRYCIENSEVFLLDSLKKYFKREIEPTDEYK